MVVAGGGRRPRAKLIEVIMSKAGTADVHCHAWEALGAARRWRGDGHRLDHGSFIEGNSRNSQYVGAAAGKWKDKVVGVCSFYSEA